MGDTMPFILNSEEVAALGRCLGCVVSKQYPGPALRDGAQRLLAKLDEQVLADINKDRGKENNG